MYAGRAMVTLPGPEREAIWTLLEEHRTKRPALPELQHGGEVEWFTRGVSVRGTCAERTPCAMRRC